ncbi:hypothetical protein L1887_07946 [Cichorium endivia]|nr:hypothetical protein L1887_07946 [Cichorium endivia]
MSISSDFSGVAHALTQAWRLASSVYAAAIVNNFGPGDTRTANCILSVPLAISRSKSSSKKNTIFAILGALIEILLFLGAVVAYKTFKNKWKQTQFHMDYVRTVKASVFPKGDIASRFWISLAT